MDSREHRLQTRESELRDRRARNDRLKSDVRSLEDVQRGRRERVEEGGLKVIEEPGKRVIVRDGGRSFIRHDVVERFRLLGHDLRTDRRPDGTVVTVDRRPSGVEVVTEQTTDGRLLRRYRRDRGREIVLIDNRQFYAGHSGRGRRYNPSDFVVDIPEPRIDRSRHIVEYSRASEDEIYDALVASPLEPLRRSYSLDQVKYTQHLRQYMKRIDLDEINFAFGSWELDQSAYQSLERIAHAMERVISRRPNEIFLIEGHTDAVGSEEDNLTLSDRRAEAVAIALTETFGLAPENLTTQGYGEQYLKVNTEEPERINRRVAIRRITPLLSQKE
ncbi:MAG: OmpA family protein [Hyphomicrobiaceae bacterium]